MPLPAPLSEAHGKRLIEAETVQIAILTRLDL